MEKGREANCESKSEKINDRFSAAVQMTANSAHMKENAQVDFTISNADMEVLKIFDRIKSYGLMRIMPVFNGK